MGRETGGISPDRAADPSRPREDAGDLPRLPEGAVDRPELRQVIGRAPLTVLRAPTGFGKTVLLTQWAAAARAEGRDVRWVSVPRDCDPADLVGLALDVLPEHTAALRRVLGKASRPARVRPGRPAPRGAGASRPPGASPRYGTTVVLDSWERVTGAEIDERLVDLVRVDPALRLVVAVRSRRVLEITGTVEVDAEVLTAERLVFTEREVAELGRNLGVRITARQATRLRRAIGGWPGATRAALLALRERGESGPRAGDGPDALRGAHDYLRHHVLPHVPGLGAPAESDRILRVTAVPDALTPEIWTLLTGQGDPVGAMTELESQGALVRERGGSDPLWHYPPAWRDMLRAELAAADPAEMARAGALLHDHHLAAGGWIGALHHALDSRSWERAAHLLGSGTRRAAEMRRRGDVVGAVEAVAPLRRAVQDNPQIEDLDPVASAALRTEWGLTRLLADDVRGAVGDLLEADRMARDHGQGHLAARASALVALSLSSLGDVPRAREWIQRASGTDPGSAGLGPGGTGPGAAGRGEAAAVDVDRTTGIALDLTEVFVGVEALDLDAARSALDRLDPETPEDELWAFAADAEARLALLHHGRVDALGQLDRVRAAHEGLFATGSTALPLLVGREADLYLALGQVHRAERTLAAPEAPLDHPRLSVPRTRTDLVAGREEAALARAEAGVWRREASIRDRLDMLVIQSVTELRLGRAEAARRSFRRACSAARRARSLRPLAVAPREEIVELVRLSGVELPARLPDLPVGQVFPARLAPVELSGRELRVLEALRTESATEALAARLYVSHNTVKTQLRSIYRKLDAHTRAEALASAYRHGLFD